MTQTGGIIYCILGMGELILLSGSFCPSQATHSCNSYQNTNGSFHGTITNNFKICMGIQKTPNSQNNLEKEEHSGGIMPPDFRPYYKATLIKTVWNQHKNRKNV